jgi:hypothetical protein
MSESSSAFSCFKALDRLENADPVRPAAYNPTVLLTRGVAGVIGQQRTAVLSGRAHAAGVLQNFTRPDGRLNVGTQLPLLAQRYQYLSVLGEGVSAQVRIHSVTTCEA